MVCLRFTTKMEYIISMKNDIIETLSYIRQNMTAENIEQFYVNFAPESALEKMDTANAETEGRNAFTAFESHKYYEMAIQLDKRSRLHIGNRSYVLCKNQFCIIPREERHRLQWDTSSQQSANMLWISITGEILRTSYSIYTDKGRSKFWGTDLHMPGNFLLGEICSEREAGGPGSTEAIVCYLKSLFSFLLQKLNFDGEFAGHSWTNAVVSELQEYMKDHLHAAISLHELSGYVSLSPNYLSKLFKQVTGETITNYFQNLKITKSIEYLADPTIPLSRISENLGFYDQFHFSKVFKTFTSMSPSQYRSTLMAQDGGREKKTQETPQN